MKRGDLEPVTVTFSEFSHTETELDTVGLWGTKAFLCPPLSCLQKIASISFQEPSLISNGQVQQLLIEKGGDAERREEKSRNNGAALGQVLFPSQEEGVSQLLEPQPGGRS